MRSERRAGSAVVLVMLAILVAGTLGSALIQRSVSAGTTAAWSRDHLVARLLAESAVEELFVQVARRANDPLSPLHAALRTITPPAGGALVPVSGISPTHLPAQLTDTGRACNARIELAASVGLRQLPAPVALARRADRTEKTALLVLEAAVTLVRGSTRVTERVRASRSLRVSRTAPPPLLDHMALLVLRTTQDDLSNFGGRPAYAQTQGSASTLLDLMTRAAPAGFQLPSVGTATALRRALRALSPNVLEQRAHYLVRTPAELERFLAARLASGGALHGVVHCSSAGPVRLRFAGFRGRCLISAEGPVEVSEITMADPGTDRLTIVTSRGISVDARRVEASLLTPGDEPVVFHQRAHVRGTVMSGRFPRGSGVSVTELGQVAFEQVAPPTEAYAVGLSAHPIAVDHARDREEWPAW